LFAILISSAVEISFKFKDYFIEQEKDKEIAEHKVSITKMMNINISEIYD
jgi:hypothetical protein